MSVTLRYPYEPSPAPKEYRGKPRIDPSLCIGCGACSRVCPPDAILVIDDTVKGYRKIILDVSRCIRCARCEEVCPTGAIKLTQEYELATNDKNDLLQVVELRLAKCSVCGRYCDYTVRQVNKALTILPSTILDRESVLEQILLCKECRKKATINKIVEQGGVLPYE
ncbi:4Fe-4S binding protein [Desulfurococcaceae archaeon MEX13E-LK6-19]|nr:4Fe-4S binding protein [Desulfurococcaceae archaeon MEX13E-LK6-19]